MNKLEEIKELLIKSDIPFDEKEELILFFRKASDAELEIIYKIFSEDLRLVQKISENIKAKKAIFAVQDLNVWNKLLEKELEELHSLET